MSNDGQLLLRLKTTWGGRRAGAGRPRADRRAGVAHRVRPEHKGRHPVHLTLRARSGLPRFRRRSTFRVVRDCIARSSNEHFRIVQFTVQNDHLHLLVEATDKRALSTGAQGLAIRTALLLNRHLGRKGKVWSDRYHMRALRSPREVRHALVYVLMNIKKHSRDYGDGLDPCSSAPWFDGFDGFASRRGPETSAEPCPTSAPRTWLASVGWRRGGLIDPDEFPRGFS